MRLIFVSICLVCFVGCRDEISSKNTPPLDKNEGQQVAITSGQTEAIANVKNAQNQQVYEQFNDKRPDIERFASYWPNVRKQAKTEVLNHEDTGAPISAKLILNDSPFEWSTAIGSRANNVEGTDMESMHIVLQSLLFGMHWEPTAIPHFQMKENGSNKILEWTVEDKIENNINHRIIKFRLKKQT